MSYNDELQQHNEQLRGILDEVKALPNGTGGVQADYEQNDPAARDYIKNRPFYDDEKWRIVHEVRQFVSTPTGIDWIIGSGNIFDTVPVGTKCRIVVDGATYIGTMAAEPDGTGYYYRHIGNGHLKNPDLPDTGEPFVFFPNGLDCMAMIPCDTMPSAATISVLESGELVRIDPKYLPDAVQADYEQNDPTAPDYLKNRPFYERVAVEEVTLAPEANTPNDSSVVDQIFAQRKTARYRVDGCSASVEYYTDIGDGTERYCLYDGQYYVRVVRGYKNSLSATLYETLRDALDTSFSTSLVGWEVTFNKKVEEIHKIDPKFLPEISGTSGPPYVIDAEAYTYGDDALAAILAGRQIYVKVPSQNPGGLYANFMPVIQYQLPQSGNDYLTLIYLKDGLAQNIMAALQTGSFDAVYGQIVMLLSQSYDDCPLKVSPIK